MAPDGLRVFVNAELKAATDRVKAVLNDSPDAFRGALHDMHTSAPFELILEKREQQRASVYTYTPQMRLHSSLLTDEATGDAAWRALAETIQRLPLPYLHIERLILPDKLMPPRDQPQRFGDEACQAVNHVVEMLRQNHAVVKLLNGM